MAKTDLKRIKHFQQGQKLPAAWTKEVATKLNGERRDFELLSMGTFYGKCAIAIPARRCLYVSSTQTTSVRPNILELTCVDDSAEGFGRIVTTGDKALKANVSGEVLFVGTTPVMLETEETTFAPGDGCGPALDGYVAKTGTGLVALVDVFTIAGLKYSWFVAEGGGGRVNGFYEIMEDDTTARQWLWARRMTRTGTPIEEWKQLYKWEDLLSNVKAGYKCKADLVDNEWCFDQGPCVPSSCNTGDRISANLPPDGVVGASYTFSFTTTGLTSGTLASSGLPPGLTRSGTTISGTPTTAGEWWALVEGSTTLGSTTCPLKRRFKFKITEPE